MRLLRYIAMASVLYMGFCICPARCFPQNGSRFHSAANGYSLTIPEDWVQMPNDALQNAHKQAISASVRADFYWETAFGLATDDGSFQYPYVIIQIMPYSSVGKGRQPYKDEIGMVVEAFSGLDLDGVVDRTLTPSAVESVLDLKPGEVLFHEGSTSYSFGLEIGRADGGKIRAIMAGHFGRSYVLQIMFYDLPENWHNSRPERDSIFSSFVFDHEMAYDEAHAFRPGISRNVDTAITKGIGGALAATALCVIIGFFRLVVSRITPKSARDSDEGGQ